MLKPGGRLHFLEHGLAREDNIRKWQTRLDRLHAALGDNCHLTREMERHLRSSRFAIEELVYLPPFSGFNALYTHILGTGVKAA